MPPFAPVPFLIAALAGLLAGCGVRAFADGFRPGPEPGPGAGRGGLLRRVYRAEVRAAFRAAVTARPLPAWPPTVEAATAASCALLAWRFSGDPALAAAACYGAVAGTALAVVDWRTRLLPDAITLPSYLILPLLLAPSGRLPAGLAGMLALGLCFAVLWFLRPDDLGLGDVKLSGLIGLLTGAAGPRTLVAAALAGLLLGALYGGVLLLTRRGNRRSEIPMGPFLLLGALAALLLAG